MNLDDGLERFHAHPMENCVSQDTGVVHNTVELSVSVDGLFDDLAGRNCFRNGLEIGDRGPAGLADFFHNLFRRRGVGASAVRRTAGVIDDDLGALGGAEQCDFPADTTAGAGNNDDLVLK